MKEFSPTANTHEVADHRHPDSLGIRKSQNEVIAQSARWQRLALVFVVFVLVLWPNRVYAGTITVDGTSCSLPDAITAANLDTATGGCTAGSGADTLVLTAQSYALGGGAYDQDGLTATPSIVSAIVISGSAEGALIERSGSDPYRLFHVSRGGNLTLANVVVRYGNVEGNGGAIFNQGELTLLDSRISLNSALQGQGGGLYNTASSTTTITNSDFAANTALVGGGIVNANGATLFLTASDLISNTALHSETAVESGWGGGLKNEGRATISDSHFISNTATLGGGIYNHGGKISATGIHFLANRAATGGGVVNYERGLATFEKCVFIANTARYGGGIENAEESTVGLSGCSFISNTATEDGGGLSNYGYSTAYIANCDFSFNTAKSGGGINSSYSSSVDLSNSRLIANSATLGGGIYSESSTLIFDVEVRANVATSRGGGLYGNAIIASSLFLYNIAGETGGAIEGSCNIVASCIMNNSDTATNCAEGDMSTATNNWWGAADGPSGGGPGLGDSVSPGLNVSPFLTSPILGCGVRYENQAHLPQIEQ